MKWRERLMLLFGLTTSAALLGVPEEVFAASSSAASADPDAAPQDHMLVFSNPSDNAALLQLAQHRSHSSHSSHRSHSSHSSHSSHYSGSGGGYAAPSYSPPPVSTYPAAPPPPAPYVGSGARRPLASDPNQTRPLTQGEVRDFVQRVQIALLLKGYDPGPTDGQLGPRTQAALRQYQTDNAIAVSGYLDVETVRRLGVVP